MLLAIGSDTYFLFSATVPYAIAGTVMYMCGLYPEEVYEGGYDAYEFMDASVFYIALAVAAVVALFYVLFFFLSKKKVGWMIATLVFFSVDTLFMMWYYGLALDMIVDFVFHGIFIVLIAIGISVFYKMQRLPDDEPVVLEGDGTEAGSGFEAPDSPILRTADTSVKSRIFLEIKAYEHTIVYRRVKKVNELVIDGYVYGEYIARLEFPHELTATVDGHIIAVGYNGSMCYIVVDGQQAASKVRWY